MNRWVEWLVGREYLDFLVELQRENSKGSTKGKTFKGLLWE